MKTIQQQYKEEMQQELHRILQFWTDHAVDTVNGGYYGRIDEHNKVDLRAPKGGVLNSRILWTFAAAAARTGDQRYGDMAHRTYRYLTDHFIDKEYGGLYWTVDYKGFPLDTKKQIYASAFAVYALSEYYRYAGEEAAKDQAVSLFRDIERHSFDPVRTGYIDAFARDWKEMDDIRLSAKDANEKKTMNTHLHILEAYTHLYRIWPDKELKEKILLLIRNFTEHIIDAHNHHLILFFDEDWRPKSSVISFGHDIEASWLIQEAAEVTGDEALIKETKQLAIVVADAAAEGLDVDGGLWYEKDGEHWIQEKHWWPQAEAMVGFMNAYQRTGDKRYLDLSLRAWQFVRLHILSAQGEWWWGVLTDYTVMQGQDKAGLWKCPYHNSRACLEVWKRLEE